MSQRHNDIDNGNVDSTSNYNFNDNVNKYSRSKRVEQIADTLLDKLGLDEGSRPFMCKVGWKLPEARIWSNLEQAMKSNRNPPGLFIFLCKRDGV